MSKKIPTSSRTIETLILFRRSLIIQVREFFENSTLHGVRYIAERDRPTGEKFMWFCFTSAGAVTALVIIMSLWEKFQTNPTITGLDTDFQNQNVYFPSTYICLKQPFDEEKALNAISELVNDIDNDTAHAALPLMRLLPSLNFDNINEAMELAKSVDPKILNAESLRYWAFQGATSCNDSLDTCRYRDDVIDCCEYFHPVYSMSGFCYAFNSRFISYVTEDKKIDQPIDLYETDKKWALYVLPKQTVGVYVLSFDEYFGVGFSSDIEWSEEYTIEIRISIMTTFTTDDARQLTVGQRKCIFPDEVKLQYYDDVYSYSSCLMECNIKKAIKLCKCNPPFFKPVPKIAMCTLDQFGCLHKFKDNITSLADCQHCELSCIKAITQIQKLTKSNANSESTGVTAAFLTWPVLRYKREVLFGWVDLLVSFGGIASLFLGFSLLSGVEIIYYFTLRACCMLYKNRQELYEIEEEIKIKPPPRIDMSLKIKFNRKDSFSTLDDKKVLTSDDKENKSKNKRKTADDYVDYAKTLYKTPKSLEVPDDNESWQYGQFLP